MEHGFFWHSLTPEAQGEPQGALRHRAFGDLNVRPGSQGEGGGHFASGWLWLVADRSGAAQLVDLHDADTPVADDTYATQRLRPGEHAYYLDYKNERGRFLDAYLNSLINWRFASGEAAQRGERGWTYPV